MAESGREPAEGTQGPVRRTSHVRRRAGLAGRRLAAALPGQGRLPARQNRRESRRSSPRTRNGWPRPGNATAVALGATHHMVGRDAIVHFLTVDFPRMFVADVTVDFRGFSADGDVVVVEETMQATPANGNVYRNDYCLVFELRDGLIHRVREYMDTANGHRMMFGDS
ncbi:nuclear transport factor 2 family protein [Streptosporangium album]|nr:nuclear transport factor 2 family protein [Streptosporangium album]